MKRKGYTLVEVMAAIVILVMAMETITISTAAALKMNGRAQKIAEAGQKVRSGNEKIPAEFSLKLSDDTEPVTGYGYVSMEEVDGDFPVRSIWTEFSAASMTDTESSEDNGGEK